MGWENIFHCEWNEFGQKILKHYWPEAKSYGDITKTDFTIHRGNIDILTGGFPCQPFSASGERRGTDDNRYLWPEMLRAISEIQPKWIVGENVRGIVNWSKGLVFDKVISDLEFEGYEVAPFLLPAVSVNAPHRRDRIWFVAHCSGSGLEGSRNDGIYKQKTLPEFTGLRSVGFTANTNGFGYPRKEYGETKTGQHPKEAEIGRWSNFPTQSPICVRDDGIPAGLDGITFPKWRNESIKGAGNAIVPQVAYQIFKAIEQYKLLTTPALESGTL